MGEVNSQFGTGTSRCCDRPDRTTSQNRARMEVEGKREKKKGRRILKERRRGGIRTGDWEAEEWGTEKKQKVVRKARLEVKEAEDVGLEETSKEERT